MKVIFCDIDGVLNCSSTPNARKFPYVIDARLLSRFKGLLEATGARMVLELEASSKADAERKAAQVGMDVTHAQPMIDEEHRHSMHRGEDVETGSGKKWLVVAAILLIVAVAAVMLWPRLRSVMQ